MIGKSTIKLIKSLALKKFRIKENLFLVEGDKIVSEVLDSDYLVEKLFVTNSYLISNKEKCKKARLFTEVSPSDIKKASQLKNPQNCLALCRIPAKSDHPNNLGNNLSIYLDDIQDPGNLGTIIRICDWFNVEYLFLSPKTVDCYMPKVIQASMGSFCRIKILTIGFEQLADFAAESDIPIYGAFLEGNNVYREMLPQRAILVMGNEGNGIQKEVEKKINKKIKIPEISLNAKRAESLNVSVATAIICSEFKRQLFS
jgi:TrmH family RNA methyltransferase